MNSHQISLAFTLSLALVVSGCSAKQKENSGYADEKRAQKVTCVNNLKGIGLAFRIWSGDHQNRYPFNVSTNNGGAQEMGMTNKEGFDDNAILYLKNMNGEDELRTPLLLICPQDSSKKAATNWTDLKSENVTYRFRSGVDIGPFSAQILAVCPIDGNVLYCDGTVLDKNGKVPKAENQ